MTIYQRLAKSSLRLLMKSGQSMTLHRVFLPSTYDPLQPQNTSLQSAVQTVGFGVVLPSSLNVAAQYDDRMLTDPLRFQSFRHVLLSGVGLTLSPQNGDVLLTGEGPYKILGATRLDPVASGVLLWNVGCTLDSSFILP